MAPTRRRRAAPPQFVDIDVRPVPPSQSRVRDSPFARRDERRRHGEERAEDDDSISLARRVARGARTRARCRRTRGSRQHRRRPAAARCARAPPVAPRGPGSGAMYHRSIARPQRRDDAVDVLVGQHRRTPRACRGWKPIVAQRVGERARRVRVVRDVEHDRRPPGQHLEAARQLDVHEPVADRARGHRQALAQRVERGQRGRRVARADTRRAAPGTAARSARRAGRGSATASRSSAKSKSRPTRSSGAPIAAACSTSAARRVAVAADRRRGPRGRCPPSRGRSPRASRRDSRRGRCRSSSRRRRRHRSTFTASSRPPSPTSRTSASSFARANSRSAASVPNSKYVSGDRRRRARLDGVERSRRARRRSLVAVDAHALVVAQQMRRRVEPDAIAGVHAASPRASRRSSPCRSCRRR